MTFAPITALRNTLAATFAKSTLAVAAVLATTAGPAAAGDEPQTMTIDGQAYQVAPVDGGASPAPQQRQQTQQVVPSQRLDQTQQVVPYDTIYPPQPIMPRGVWSGVLGARFEIVRMTAVGQSFLAARLTENPVPGSPLQSLGLRAGDIITRLDGLRTTSYFELDNHVWNTTVRYLRMGQPHFTNGSIYIRGNHRFVDPYYGRGSPSPYPVYDQSVSYHP